MLNLDNTADLTVFIIALGLPWVTLPVSLFVLGRHLKYAWKYRALNEHDSLQRYAWHLRDRIKVLELSKHRFDKLDAQLDLNEMRRQQRGYAPYSPVKGR